MDGKPEEHSTAEEAAGAVTGRVEKERIGKIGDAIHISGN